MRDHSECFRAYHRSSKAWYKDSLGGKLEVSFGMYHPEGGTTGEITMEWIMLDGKLCAQLKAFEDSWSALALFTDVIQELAEVDSDLITEEEFIYILDKCAFQDLTAYTR